MQDTGFTDIQQVTVKVPMNGWAQDPFLKECGLWLGASLVEGLEALSIGPFTRVLGWSALDVKSFLEPVKKEIQNKNIHAYYNV